MTDTLAARAKAVLDAMPSAWSRYDEDAFMEKNGAALADLLRTLSTAAESGEAAREFAEALYRCAHGGFSSDVARMTTAIKQRDAALLAEAEQEIDIAREQFRWASKQLSAAEQQRQRDVQQARRNSLEEARDLMCPYCKAGYLMTNDGRHNAPGEFDGHCRALPIHAALSAAASPEAPRTDDEAGM